MPYSVQRLVPEHAQAAKALLTCFFQDMADPAVKFWLQRYGAILAAILTVAFVYLPTSAWFALVIAIGGALQCKPDFLQRKGPEIASPLAPERYSSWLLGNAAIHCQFQ
eukprot:TRINITY_DN5480_c0_g1_i2.p2 TRINITY_DN5480_c0_g1~~TRINITY_DN5480_c0_g1_i2.p2  ORF type:complete len:109 (+),score=2.78 TRINITY_DN5480_c0_g1_i2:108-434(+)